MKLTSKAASIVFASVVLSAAMTMGEYPATRPARAAPAQSKFLRFVPDNHGGGTLQASIVRYVNDDGVIVDLVSAVHIAEPSFFQQLDDSFTDYDAVLYEMVSPKEGEPPPTTQRSMIWLGRFQRGLRDALDLSFQLEEIDYKRPNFVHADMDLGAFQQMQAERKESFLSMAFASAAHNMDNPRAAAAQPNPIELLAALTAPDRPRRLKLIMARTMGAMGDSLGGMDGPRGSVIISERNKVALQRLSQQIADGKKTLAIFYGAGHFRSMEKTLTEEMGFRQVGPPMWRIAWDMSTHLPHPATRPATGPSTVPAHG
ncbi:MAG: hypothetical protein ACREJC_16850 [Tepidisphaeraceae bacterium]